MTSQSLLIMVSVKIITSSREKNIPKKAGIENFYCVYNKMKK
jgi:hypothetical protein